MKGFKAFNKNMTCRGFQYEENKEYKMDGAPSICDRGFHYCKNPFDVLNYYNLIDSEFASIEASGKIDKDSNGSKHASTKIKIGIRLGLSGFIKACVDFIIDHCSVAVSGDVDVDEKYAQIGSSGYSAQIGSSGDSAKIGSSGYSAKIGSSGDYAQIGSSGYSAQIGSSGYSAKIELNGEDSVGMSAGIDSKIKGKVGNWITLSEWKYSQAKGRHIPLCVRSVKIDGEVIKGDTWYTLKNGEFTEAE